MIKRVLAGCAVLVLAAAGCGSGSSKFSLGATTTAGNAATERQGTTTAPDGPLGRIAPKSTTTVKAPSGSLTSPPTTVFTTAACSAPLLFQAAVAKEGFNPDDPSYAAMAQDGEGAGAYDVSCDQSYAVATISRPNVGKTDGATAFKSVSGKWVEIGQLGDAISACRLTGLGVPATVALVLASGVRDSPDGDCTFVEGPSSTTVAPAALPVFDVPGPEGYDGIKPTAIYFSGDGSDVITGITWSAWTASGAVGSGTWTYESCDPDCASGAQDPYPATITLGNPVAGRFTTMVQSTSGPHGFTKTYTYPDAWAQGAQ